MRLNRKFKAAVSIVGILLGCVFLSQGQITEPERKALSSDLEFVFNKHNSSTGYIQTNKSVYETGEDLWFKLYMIDNRNQSPFVKDSILYLQLLNTETHKVVWQEKYPIEDGFADGRIYLSDTLSNNNYKMLAYTASSGYHGEQPYAAEKYLTIRKNILNPIVVETEFDKKIYNRLEPINIKIKLRDKEGAAVVNAHVAGTYLSDNILNSSVLGKSNESGEITLAFKPFSGAGSAQIRLDITDNVNAPETVWRVVPYKQRSFILKIYPEGGHLIAGIKNRVAFKATDDTGKPVDVSGHFCVNKTAVVNIKSEHQGMGSFYFRPKMGETYDIKINEDTVNSFHPIIEIPQNGIALNLIKNDTSIISFKIRSTPSSTVRTVYLRAQNRGHIYVIAKAILKDSVVVSIPVRQLPIGIVEFTLFDQGFVPLAERLSFVNRMKIVKPSLILNKAIFRARERVTLKIKLNEGIGNSNIADLGLSVFDNLFYENFSGEDITGYYYLSSQLKGKVHRSSEYFINNDIRSGQNLDLLMLVNGWKKYIWNKEAANPGKSPEFFNYLDGQISAKRNTPVGNLNLLLYSPANQQFKSIISTDTNGRFIIFPDDLKKATGNYVYIKPVTKIESSFSIKISDPFPAITKSRDLMNDIFPYPLQYTSNNDTISNLSLNSARMLSKVMVFGKAKFSKRDKYLSKIDSLSKLTMITDYITHSIDGGKSGTLNCPACTNAAEKYVPLDGHRYNVIHQEDIVSMNTGGKHIVYNRAYSERYKAPQFSEDEILKFNNLARTKGYFPSETFEEIKYESADEKNSQIPDYRNALIWNPHIVVDANGEATVSFFTSDINGKFRVQIEGISSEGKVYSSNSFFYVQHSN